MLEGVSYVVRVELAFAHRREGALHVWHFAPATLMTRDGPKHPVLAERDSPAMRHVDLMLPGSPLHEFGTTAGSFAAAAAYLGLAFRLTAGLERWVLPAYYRDHAEKALGREPELVRWEFEVEIPPDGSACRPVGFVPAHACVPYDSTVEERARADRAGLFEIRTFRELAAANLALSSDASSELSLFGIMPGEIGRLTEALRGERKPELAELLRPGEVFVDVVMGYDLGYPDSLLIASRDDISERIEILRGETVAGLARFEAEVEQVGDIAGYMRLLRRIAFGADGAG